MNRIIIHRSQCARFLRVKTFTEKEIKTGIKRTGMSNPATIFSTAEVCWHRDSVVERGCDSLRGEPAS